jgi:hypothetical protein
MTYFIIDILIKLLCRLSDGWSIGFLDFDDEYKNLPDILKKECLMTVKYNFIPKDVMKKHKKEIKEFLVTVD